MGRFYLRVFRDGEREKTWGCGSRGENDTHFNRLRTKYLSDAIHRHHGYPVNDLPGRKYRIEFIKNRHGEKEMYREVEFELDYLNGGPPGLRITKNSFGYPYHNNRIYDNTKLLIEQAAKDNEKYIFMGEDDHPI